MSLSYAIGSMNGVLLLTVDEDDICLLCCSLLGVLPCVHRTSLPDLFAGVLCSLLDNLIGSFCSSSCTLTKETETLCVKLLHLQHHPLQPRSHAR